MTVEQVKASILQLAIQGKLVQQDPNDEPASELLKRIEAAKNAKGAKKGKSLPPITDDEKPFDIPDSWEWVRLGGVCEVIRGSGIMRSDTVSKGVQCVRYGEIYTTYGFSFEHAKSFVSERVAGNCHEIVSGDVLCTLTGECKEEIAKATAFLGTKRTVIGGDLAKITNHPFEPLLLVYFFFSPFMILQKAAKSNGDIIVHIGKNAVESLLIPLPPLAEQKRIVAKVEALFGYVDECEDSRKQLAENLSETLIRSVLQEAIQGRLVPQDPNDEPASELLKQIAAEREKQIAEKKIKKSKPLPPIKDEEKPFPIPDSWVWVRLGEIVHYSMGKTPPRSDVKYWMNGAYNWVSISDMVADGYIVATNERVSVIAAKTIFGGRISEPGTLLMSFKLTVGKVSILDIPAFHNEAMISIYPFVDNGNTTRDYLFKVLPVLSQNGETKSAIKGNTLNSSSLNNLLIPLPPLAEQKRIVAKVDSIFAKIVEVREAVC